MSEDDRRVYGPIAPLGLTSKERSAWLYRERKAAGICVTCGKRMAEPGRVKCAECTAERRQWYATRRELYPEKVKAENERYRESHLRNKKARNAKRIAAGICTQCGKRPAAEGRTLCEVCIAKNRKTAYRYFAETRRKGYAELGLCKICGKPVVEGYAFCPEHLEQYRQKGRELAYHPNTQAARERRKVYEDRVFRAEHPPKEAKEQ